MIFNKRHIYFWGVIALLLVAGLCNLVTVESGLFFNTLAFTTNFIIYEGILLVWIMSIRTRLLPGKARRYVIFAAALMFFYLVLRVYKYRLSHYYFLQNRYAAYLFYLPMTLIPALFLLTCLQISHGEGERTKKEELFCLIPAVIFSAFFLTNDLHHLVYVPDPGAGGFWLEKDAYTYGPMFFATYGFIALTILGGLIQLFRAREGRGFKRIAAPIGVMVFWCVMIGAWALFHTLNLRIPYHFPEICVFCYVAIFEVCIHEKMIPCNEDYSGLFANMRFPVMITDNHLFPICQTAMPVNSTKEQRSSVLETPAYVAPEIRLSSKALKFGYVFWTEDESELHRLNSQLEDEGKVLAEENELIEAENKLKERRTHVMLRNRIYAQVSKETFPAQKRLAALLREASPEKPDFQETMARILVIFAYVKRASNLFLVDAGREDVPSRELYLALSESARYLSHCGVKMQVTSFQEGRTSRRVALDLYACFEEMMERWLPEPRKLSVAYSDGELRLITNASAVPAFEDLSLPVKAEQSDDLWFLTISAKGGGVK